MTNIQIYCVIVCAFAFMFARYAAIGNCVRGWVRILLGEQTVMEAVAADTENGTDSALYHHVALSTENQELRDMLRPPLYHAKNTIALFGGSLFILSGFLWTRWYYPLVALPVFALILPRLFSPLLRGKSQGYKSRLLQGLDVKIEVASKFDSDEKIALYTDLRDQLSSATWRR